MCFGGFNFMMYQFNLMIYHIKPYDLPILREIAETSSLGPNQADHKVKPS